MSEMHAEDFGETPSIEVRVFRDGEVIASELCESEEQAALVVQSWCEVEGVDCEIDDLTVRHNDPDLLEPELTSDADEFG